MVVQKVILLGCILFVVSVVEAASKDEILHTSLYRLAEGHIEKNTNPPPSSLSTHETTTKPISTKSTTLKPVYIPPSSTVKPTTESTSEKGVNETTISNASEQSVVPREHHAHHNTKTDSGHPTKKEEETFVVEKKEHEKSKENPQDEETAHTVIKTAVQRETNQNEIAQQKSGLFTSATVPFLASIGTAIALGGLAYYAYPVPEVTARADVLNPGSFDNGVRIVHPSDLTPQEVRRLMNAEAYHASARSSTDEKKPHPYIDLAKRFISYATPVYQYLAPSFLGGNSDEEDSGDEYDIGSFQSQPPFAGSGNTNRLIQPIYNAGHQNIGPHILGQPNAGQHIVAQPNVGQHVIGHQNIGPHILGQPNAGQHIVAQPNVGQHVIGQKNIAQPNIGQRIFGPPVVGQYVNGQQHIGQPHVG